MTRRHPLGLSARFAAFLPVLGVIAGMIPCLGASAADVSIRFDLGFSFEGAQAFFPLAQDRGCFQRQGIDVTMDRGYGSSDTATKVASGAYDLGEVDFNTLVQFDARNPDKLLIAIFMISDSSPLSVQVLKKSGITKPKDLVGKRISDLLGDSSRVMFPAFAKANDFDPNSVTWLTAAPALRSQLVVQDRADAVAGHMFNILTGLRGLGVSDDQITILRYSDWGVDFYGSTIAATPAWVAAHPDAAKGFVHCTVEGIKATIADPKAGVAAVKKRNPLADSETDAASLDFALSRVIITPYVKKNGLSAVDRARMERTIKQASEALEIKEPPLDMVWTDKYLPAASEMMLDH